MKGKDIFTKLYDRALYAYLYFWICVDQKIEAYRDHRANIRWIRENGPYNG